MELHRAGRATAHTNLRAIFLICPTAPTLSHQQPVSLLQTTSARISLLILASTQQISDCISTVMRAITGVVEEKETEVQLVGPNFD
jgi:hypothetical protein